MHDSKVEISSTMIFINALTTTALLSNQNMSQFIYYICLSQGQMFGINFSTEIIRALKTYSIVLITPCFVNKKKRETLKFLVKRK